MKILNLEMTFFMNALWKVLEGNPKNPNPDCPGCYIVHYDYDTGKTETILFRSVLKSNQYKYIYLAHKKTLQTVYKETLLSRDFLNEELEQAPGAVNIIPEIVFAVRHVGGCVGVSGHIPLVEEAISALLLTAKNSMVKIHADKHVCTEDLEKEFWVDFSFEFHRLCRKIYDNFWIKELGEALLLSQNHPLGIVNN